jgi:hypothetical protein
MDPYIDIVEADAYFENRLFDEAWQDADDVTRLKALKHATLLIDRLNIKGCKVEGQEREFPRTPDLEIPEDIKCACAEIALQLLDFRDLEMDAEAQSQASGTLGVVSMRSQFQNTHIAYVNGIPSITAWSYLRPYLIDPQQVTLRRTS